MLSESKLRAIEEKLTSAMCDGVSSTTEIADLAVRELRSLVGEIRRLNRVTYPRESRAE